MAMSALKQAGCDGLDLADAEALVGRTVRYVFTVNRFGMTEDHDAIIDGCTSKRVRIIDRSAGDTVRMVKAHNLYLVGGVA